MDERALTIRVTTLQRALIAVLIVLGLGGAALGGWAAARLVPGTLASSVDPAAYQAIFLTGGQIYFGKARIDSDAAILTEVHYLGEATESQPRGQLIRRGSEIHGPREPLVVPLGQILFIENLSEGSEVVQAILRSRDGPPAATPTPTGR